jgi:hypothetical protein
LSVIVMTVAHVRQRRQLTLEQLGELRLDDGGRADEMEFERCRQLCERQQRARHGGPGGEVAPHGVHADARQAYAS